MLRTVPSRETCVVLSQWHREDTSLVASGCLVVKREDVGIVISRGEVRELAELFERCAAICGLPILSSKESDLIHRRVHTGEGIYSGIHACYAVYWRGPVALRYVVCSAQRCQRKASGASSALLLPRCRRCFLLHGPSLLHQRESADHAPRHVKCVREGSWEQ